MLPEDARPLEDERVGVRSAILVAVLVSFLLDLLLNPPGNGPFGLPSRVLGFLAGALLAFLLGRWLGKRVWPRHGRRLARALLNRDLRRPARPLIFLTNRPDRRVSLPRRTLEVVGFAAGSSILLSVGLTLAGMPYETASGVVGTFAIVALYASFLLVPYWVFGRLGLRHVDPIRWLVQPLSSRYGDRLRLSNGVLLFFALFGVFNLAYRAGASQERALLLGVLTLARLVAAMLIVAAAGAAYYTAQERTFLRELERETLALGVRDGRRLSDGDFLPRLPPQETVG